MAEIVERTSVLIGLRAGRLMEFEAALAVIGLSLPPIGRFTETGGLLLARVGPHQIMAMRDGADMPLMEELEPLASEAGLIDLSDARIGVRLAGPEARTRLAHLAPIDLHPGKVGPGCCAQTMMAHLSVLLLQLGPQEYEVQCGRSFAGSFLRAVDMPVAIGP